MEALLDTIIYLVITMGLIVLVGSFFDIFKCDNIEDIYKKYMFKDRGVKNEKYIEVIIRVNNYNQKEKEEIVNRISKGEFENINEIVDYFKVEETFDN